MIIQRHYKDDRIFQIMLSYKIATLSYMNQKDYYFMSNDNLCEMDLCRILLILGLGIV